ncbi:hypothetical protein SBA6_950029 [Candidatus Sulfopaludibacter sp. SbA6]|nr:hypothetical protein SBA6_950029 [Candidatus Sulfopaludibacter sp. SbA6]
MRRTTRDCIARPKPSCERSAVLTAPEAEKSLVGIFCDCITPSLDIEQCVILASYMLSYTKERVQYCGGHSLTRILRHDGKTISNEEEQRLAQVSGHFERTGNWFIWQAQQFLLRHTLGGMETFSRNLTALDSRATLIRNLWQELNQSGTVDRRLTIPDPSNLPPWLE